MRTHLTGRCESYWGEFAVLLLRCDCSVAGQPSWPGPKGAPRPTGPGLVLRDDSVVVPAEFEVTREVVLTGVVPTDAFGDDVAAAPLPSGRAVVEAAGTGVLTNVVVRAAAAAT